MTITNATKTTPSTQRNIINPTRAHNTPFLRLKQINSVKYELLDVNRALDSLMGK